MPSRVDKLLAYGDPFFDPGDRRMVTKKLNTMLEANQNKNFVQII